MSWTRVRLAKLNLKHDVWELTSFLNSLAIFWNSVPAVRLDLSTCTFLNAEGAAMLAAFALHRREWGGQTEVDWETGSYDLKRQLGRWRIAELFGNDNFPWTDNAIPLFHQTRLDADAAIKYICSVIRAGENMPSMTPVLEKETNRSFCELFVNVSEHANSPCGGLAIGQYYPNVKQVQFCVCDVGMGLVQNVQRAGHAPECCGAAIRWALGEGNSTKHVLGGLGLYLLQDFVKANGGSLRILANTGYYTLNEGRESSTTLRVAFPGTLIQVGLLLRPNEVYTIG